MKKTSLMGASVVAAALLAAAPVVAPVASLATPGTQVVKADTTEQQAVNNYIGRLMGTLKGSNSDDNPGLLSGNFIDKDIAQPTNELHDGSSLVRTKFSTGFSDKGNNVHLTNVTQPSTSTKSDATFNDIYIQNGATVNNNIITSPSPNGSANELEAVKNYVEYSLSYTVNYAGGGTKTLYTSEEVANAIKELQTSGGTLTAHYQFFNTYDNGNTLIGSSNPVVTFKPNTVSKKALFVTVNDVTVPNGTPVDIFNSRSSVADNGGKVLNEKGENIISSLNSDKFGVGNLKYDLVAGKISGRPVNDETLQEGSYKQDITFSLSALFDGVDDGTLGKLDNAGRISFNGHSWTDIKNGKVAGMKYAGGVVTITRKVTVGKPGVTDAPYTAEKVDGVVTVTTKEGTAAQVYDQAGNPVYSRALAPGSRWVTGQKRTLLKNGKVYYQVSTNEFLSADDVSYTANSASSSEHLKGAVKVTQIGKKVFTVADGNYGYVWAKDDDNNGMHLVKSRFLAPNSKWQSGAKANMTDSDGNTHEFYQVSTNEWIDGSVGSIN